MLGKEAGPRVNRDGGADASGHHQHQQRKTVRPEINAQRRAPAADPMGLHATRQHRAGELNSGRADHRHCAECEPAPAPGQRKGQRGCGERRENQQRNGQTEFMPMVLPRAPRPQRELRPQRSRRLHRHPSSTSPVGCLHAIRQRQRQARRADGHHDTGQHHRVGHRIGHRAGRLRSQRDEHQEHAAAHDVERQDASQQMRLDQQRVKADGEQRRAREQINAVIGVRHGRSRLFAVKGVVRPPVGRRDRAGPASDRWK